MKCLNEKGKMRKFYNPLTKKNPDMLLHSPPQSCTHDDKKNVGIIVFEAYQG